MSGIEMDHDFSEEATVGSTSYLCNGTVSFNYYPGTPCRQPVHLDDDGDEGEADDYDNFSITVDSVSWEDESEIEQDDINDSPIDAIKESLIHHFKEEAEKGNLT